MLTESISTKLHWNGVRNIHREAAPFWFFFWLLLHFGWFPTTHPSFQPRSSTLQQNLLSLPYISRHDKLIPVIFNKILQVGNLLLCHPNVPFFFMIKLNSLTENLNTSLIWPPSTQCSWFQAPKDALFKEKLMKRAHEVSASSNTMFSNFRKTFSSASSRLPSGSKPSHLAFSNNRDRQFPSPG